MALFNNAAMFGNDPKLVRDWYSDVLNGQQDLTTAGLGTNRTANQADLDTFTNALKGSISRVNALEPGDTGALTGMIGTLSNPDALSLYRGVGDYRTGLLNKFSADLAGQGSASDKLAQARLGYGGRGPSTYASNSLIDRISKNLVPAFQSTIGSIGADTSSLQTNQRANFDQSVGLIDKRAQIPLRSTLLNLLPIQVRQQLMQDEIGNETALGSAYRNNLLGTHLKTDRLTKILQGSDDSANTGADIGISLIKDYLGDKGGASSGVTASGANGSANSAGLQALISQYGGGSGNGAGRGGGNSGSGGGQNSQQIMQLLQMIMGGGGSNSFNGGGGNFSVPANQGFDYSPGLFGGGGSV